MPNRPWQSPYEAFGPMWGMPVGRECYNRHQSSGSDSLSLGEAPGIDFERSTFMDHRMKLVVKVPAVYENTVISFAEATDDSAEFIETDYIMSRNNGDFPGEWTNTAGWFVTQGDQAIDEAWACYRRYEVEMRWEDMLTADWAGLHMDEITGQENGFEGQEGPGLRYTGVMRLATE